MEDRFTIHEDRKAIDTTAEGAVSTTHRPNPSPGQQALEAAIATMEKMHQMRKKAE